MRNTTKKNLKDLIILFNEHAEFIQNLIDHKAPDWSVETLCGDLKEDLDEQFRKIMNK